MKIIIILLFMANTAIINAQSSLYHCSIPQSVFVAGDNVKIGMYAHTTEKLYTYLILLDIDNKVVKTEHVKLDKTITTISFILPQSLKSASYQLISFILNSDGYTVVEQHSFMIHVTDGRNTVYHKYENHSPLPKEILSINKIKIGEEIPYKIHLNATIMAVNKSYQAGHCYIHHSPLQSNPGTDTTFRIFIKVPSGFINGVALNIDRKICAKLIPTKDQQIYSVPFNPYTYNNAFSILDIQSIKPYENWPYVLPPLNISTSIPCDASKEINAIYSEAIQRLKIQQYMLPLTQDSTDINITTINIKADNEYILDNYEKFESIQAFFKEIILPYKISDYNNTKQLYLLTGVERKWNVQPACIIIDGDVVDHYSAIFAMPYDDIISVRLYRKLETLRQSYGAMGRNGIIEVTTKRKASKVPLRLPSELKPYTEIRGNASNVHWPLIDQTIFLSTKPFRHNDAIGTFNIYDLSSSELILQYQVD